MSIQYSAVSDEKPRQLVSYVMLTIHKFYKQIPHSAIHGFKESTEHTAVMTDLFRTLLHTSQQFVCELLRLVCQNKFYSDYSSSI